MSKKKRIVLGFLIFLLLASTVFIISYSADSKRTFSEFVESGDLSNLRLTIYFLHSSYIEQDISINDLKTGYYDYKIVVKSNYLEKNMDSLKELNKEPLIPLQQKTYINCRMYYVFTTYWGHKLYDVALWGYNGKTLSIYVNGTFVNESDVYYNVILPFLPQDAADELRKLVADMRQKLQ